jgi:flagellin
MALSVRTNVASIRASGQLSRTQSSLTQSLERISSGLRINRAGDDAAGMSVASRMNADNTSLKQSIRNTNDGVSMVQTAEGGLNEIYNILVRMRELSVQASTETYNSNDRSQMNTEFNQLVNEIKRIASVAQFNRTNLLKGLDANSTSQFTIQVGIFANSDNQININMSTIAATLRALGLATLKTSGITTLANAGTFITTLDKALNAVNSRRAYLGAVKNRL